jgi:hypothetical protein
MVPHQCKNLERILLIQPLLILEAPNFLFLQMFLRKSEQSGAKLYPTSTARVMQLSATSQNPVKLSLKKLNQLVFK